MANLITMAEAVQRVRYTRQHIDRLWKAGQFPKPIKLGDARTSRVMFLEDEIDAWLAGRVAVRDDLFSPLPA